MCIKIYWCTQFFHARPDDKAEAIKYSRVERRERLSCSVQAQQIPAGSSAMEKMHPVAQSTMVFIANRKSMLISFVVKYE